MTKRAIVTGASSGIGQEFARKLAADGWSVTGVARGAAALDALIQSLPGSGHELLVADLSTEEGISAVSAHLTATKYDLLVNNAGTATAGLFETAPLEKLQSILQVNVAAVYRLTHAYLRTAKAGDAVINNASVEGLVPFPGQALYAASKAFVVSLSESLWYEWRDRGVYVMALCPGVTRTPLIDQAGSMFDDVPKVMIGDVDGVVSTALAALRRRRAPTVIPGAINKIWVFSSRFLTRRATARVMGSIAPKQSLALVPALADAAREPR